MTSTGHVFGPGPVLLTLTSWTESHVSAILNATTSKDLDAAFDAFLSKKALITVNGVSFSRDQYKNFLQREKFDEVSAVIKFSGKVEVPSDNHSTFEAGSIGLFYTSVIGEAIVIHDAPVQRQLTSSLNVFIDQDPSIPGPTTGPVPGLADRRRVMSLNQVVANGVPQDAL